MEINAFIEEIILKNSLFWKKKKLHIVMHVCWSAKCFYSPT